MGVVNLTIDDIEVKAEKGMTILEAAQSVGINIPTLCHHEKLETYTACRLCMVEVEARGRVKLDTACSSPVKEGQVVRTKTERIMKIRKTLLELMLAHAPDSRDLQDYVREYGADRKRFEKMSSFCIHCGLCVRYCAEVKKKSAVVFVGSGVSREISFVPDVASKECWNCKECFPLCPTEALQAAYVLSGSLLLSLPTLAGV